MEKIKLKSYEVWSEKGVSGSFSVYGSVASIRKVGIVKAHNIEEAVRKAQVKFNERFIKVKGEDGLLHRESPFSGKVY